MARRQRVTRRDYAPEQDWRGIAMLAQQLGQLFEPSKAKLQSRAQEHEMRLLEAKQAWKFGEEQLKANKDQLMQARKDLDTAQGKLEVFGADVMDVAQNEFSVPDAASTIFEDNDVRSVKDLNDLANQYHEQLMATKKRLDQFEDMNTHAVFGEGWRKGGMKTEDEGGNVKDYYTEANKDGMPGLSYEEGQGAVKQYIKDNYLLEEGQEGVDMTFGEETFTVSPEAVAFRAGFEADVGAATGRGKKEKELAKYAPKQGEESWPDYDDQQLADRYTDATDTIERINNKYKGKAKATIGQFLEVVDGTYTPKDVAALAKYDTDDVNAYIAARNIELTSSRHMQKRMISADIDISKQGYVISNEMRKDFNSAVVGTEIDPNNMYNNIVSSDPSKEGYNEAINMYNEFLRDYNTYPKDKRLLIIKSLNDWVNK